MGKVDSAPHRGCKIREPVNALTHFTTCVAAIVGLVFIIVLTRGNIPKLVTMTIYGISVVALFGASTIYHWVRTIPEKLLILKKLDHVAIYLLIAGSYTPVFFYGLEGAWKWSMLIAIWVLTVIGILVKLWFIHLPRYVSTAFYVTLGWIALVPFAQMVGNLPVGALAMMVAGGVAYTIGAVIYATRCLNFWPNRFGFHEIFHLFVMAGSITHFVMMMVYIVPM